MAPDNDPVEITVKASVEPTADDETVEGEPSAEGGESEGEGEPEGGGRQPKEQIVRRQPAPATEKKEEEDADNLNEDDLADVEGETPRERALRLEVTRLKGLNRKERGNELLGNHQPAPTQKKELDPQKAAVLGKYKPEEINSLREVLPVLAEEMGYVRTDQLNATTYNKEAGNELDTFLEKHPEYLPENDKGNILWERFNEEFKMYRQPENPRDFKRIFDRIHKDIFGIKVTGEGKGKQEAAQRKVQSASHAGASAPTRSAPTAKPKQNTSGLRLDMLKGFSDEDLAAMTGE